MTRRNPLLCSTGAFVSRLNGRDYTLIPRIAPQLAADGLEFMMYDSWYDCADEITAMLSGLSVPVMHVDKQVGEAISRGAAGDEAAAFAAFRRNCRMAQRIGAHLLVLHLWNGLPSDHVFSRNLAAFGELARAAQDAGLLLTVENVVCAAADPLARLRELRERYPDVRFTYDTKMAAFHHQQDAWDTPEGAWLWDEHRIAHVHLNDYAGGYRDWAHLRVPSPGAGWVDLPHACAVLAAHGYTGAITTEAPAVSTDGAVDVARLNANLCALRQMLDTAS